MIIRETSGFTAPKQMVEVKAAAFIQDERSETPARTDVRVRSDATFFLKEVPAEGRIAVVEAGKPLDRAVSRRQFQQAERLASIPLGTRGWTAALLLRLHQLPSANFSLEQAYGFTAQLQQLFPQNSHIREKIRQQLQVLRDAGMVTFDGRGSYTLVAKR